MVKITYEQVTPQTGLCPVAGRGAVGWILPVGVRELLEIWGFPGTWLNVFNSERVVPTGIVLTHP